MLYLRNQRFLGGSGARMAIYRLYMNIEYIYVFVYKRAVCIHTHTQIYTYIHINTEYFKGKI